ncbi:MAG: hypothetical protein CL489_10285 [Acidobacteria bacterium]|nr:hypothetical protein [Acidobacteriota bacterium]|tara:strand:+ start:9232 stop:9579 length:348 start_codon:yes stop_codon:yes gene_type:complete
MQITNEQLEDYMNALENKIDLWHDGQYGDLSLPEALEMSDSEYALYCKSQKAYEQYYYILKQHLYKPIDKGLKHMRIGLLSPAKENIDELVKLYREKGFDCVTYYRTTLQFNSIL